MSCATREGGMRAQTPGSVWEAGSTGVSREVASSDSEEARGFTSLGIMGEMMEGGSSTEEGSAECMLSEEAVED